MSPQCWTSWLPQTEARVRQGQARLIGFCQRQVWFCCRLFYPNIPAWLNWVLPPCGSRTLVEPHQDDENAVKGHSDCDCLLCSIATGSWQGWWQFGSAIACVLFVHNFYIILILFVESDPAWWHSNSILYCFLITVSSSSADLPPNFQRQRKQPFSNLPPFLGVPKSLPTFTTNHGYSAKRAIFTDHYQTRCKICYFLTQL